MRQKKVLQVWQMTLIAFFALVIMVSMFLPAFHFNGKVVGKIYSYVVKNVKEETKNSIFSGVIREGLADELEKDDIQKIDDEIADLEKDSGVKISSISPFRIMTHSLTGILLGKNADKDDIEDVKDDLGENYKTVNCGYTIIRVSLIMIYMFAFAVLLITIMAFVCKWSKMVPLIISMVYSVMAVIFFGYLRFGLMRTIAGKVEASLGSLVNKIADIGSLEGSTAGFSKILSYLYSISFLLAFIVSALLLAIGIVSLVLNTEEEMIGDGDFTLYDSDFQSDSFSTYAITDSSAKSFESDEGSVKEEELFGFQGNNMSGSQAASVMPVTMAEPDLSAAPAVPAAVTMHPMGKVQCTKGAAMGRGFQLPKDRKVIVGKSPQKSNLVVNDQHISNIHCSIRYNPENNTYSVIDHSTNGVFVNGVRLQKDVPVIYPAGTVLSLADGNNEITLG